VNRTTDPSLIPESARDEVRRRTKIVATLGPATDDAKVIEQLILGGADVFRVNFSHGTGADQAARVARVHQVSEKVGRHIGIMGDLQGPKIRVESFKAGSVMLVEDHEFVLDVAMDPNGGDQHAVGCAYRNLTNDVVAGDTLLLDDGLIVLEVERVAGSRIHTRVKQGGKLADHKGLNKQGGGLSAPALTDKDRRDIESAAKFKLDFMSVSFARNADDIEEARSLLRAAGGHAHIVAKIERAEAVTNIRSIIDASDVIMVARGDLAVEVGYASMTGLQKGLIRLTRARNKVCITATQMLESMINSPRCRTSRTPSWTAPTPSCSRPRPPSASIPCAPCARWPSFASAPRSTRRSAAPRTTGSRTCSPKPTKPSRWPSCTSRTIST